MTVWTTEKVEQEREGSLQRARYRVSEDAKHRYIFLANFSLVIINRHTCVTEGYNTARSNQ